MLLQLWTSYITSHDRAVGILASVRLWGTWQSCLQDDATYGEMDFVQVTNGKALWTLHLGPSDDFALFKGIAPDDDDHDDPKVNLLGVAHRFNSLPSKSGRNWTIPTLHLRINVVAAGGSRSECDSFVIKVEDL